MFDWSSFLQVARELVSRPPDQFSEGAKRSAVSRAYYAAFCSLRNYTVQKLGFSTPKQSFRVHQDLQRHLQKLSGWEDIADKLKELRMYRNQCDYEDKIDNIEKIVESSLRLASDILDRLQ